MAVVTGFDGEIEELWERMRPFAVTRVEVLARAVTAADLDRLDDPLRNEAHIAAHKLIGALGSYGRPAGSQAAADFERALSVEPVDVPTMRTSLARLREVVQGALR